MADRQTTSTCIVCKEKFTYEVKLRRSGSTGNNNQYAFRKVCDECRRKKRIKTSRDWKVAHGLTSTPVKLHAKKTDGIVKATHEEVAKALKMSARDVISLEQQVFFKIRNNPELKELWSNFKEDGMPNLSEGLFRRTDEGLALLDFQMAVVDWWAVHDMIAESGQFSEAMECLNEIEQFQHTIVETLSNL